MLLSTLGTVWKTFLSTETGSVQWNYQILTSVIFILKKKHFLEKCPNCSDFLLRAFSMIIKSTSVIKILCSIYDIVDKQDHPTLHLHLARYSHHSHQFIHLHHHLHDDHGQGRGWWDWQRVAKVEFKIKAADLSMQVMTMMINIDKECYDYQNHQNEISTKR